MNSGNLNLYDWEIEQSETLGSVNAYYQSMKDQHDNTTNLNPNISQYVQGPDLGDAAPAPPRKPIQTQPMVNKRIMTYGGRTPSMSAQHVAFENVLRGDLNFSSERDPMYQQNQLQARQDAMNEMAPLFETPIETTPPSSGLHDRINIRSGENERYNLHLGQLARRSALPMRDQISDSSSYIRDAESSQAKIQNMMRNHTGSFESFDNSYGFNMPPGSVGAMGKMGNSLFNE